MTLHVGTHSVAKNGLNDRPVLVVHLGRDVVDVGRQSVSVLQQLQRVQTHVKEVDLGGQLET